LSKIYVLGHGYEAIFVECTVFSKTTIDNATEAGLDGVSVERSCEMALVEEDDNLVALLEPAHVFANALHGPGSIRGRDDIVCNAEGVLSLWNDEVAVVEGGGVNYNGYSMLE
jgi:hypothetical protein